MERAKVIGAVTLNVTPVATVKRTNRYIQKPLKTRLAPVLAEAFKRKFGCLER